MSVIKSDYACKCNLPYNSEGLDGKDDKDWSIPRLDNPECAYLGDPSDSGLATFIVLFMSILFDFLQRLHFNKKK